MNIYAFSIKGCTGELVNVECDISLGLPGLVLIGLPRGAVRECHNRVRAAIRNTGLAIPPKKITVNLYPAGLIKEESLLDLAVAMKVLETTSQLVFDSPERIRQIDESRGIMFLGELHLDGSVGEVPGVLAAVMEGLEHGFKDFAVPALNAAEAASAGDCRVYPVGSLADTIGIFTGSTKPLDSTNASGSFSFGLSSASKPEAVSTTFPADKPDFSNCHLTKETCQLLAVAAAGRHNTLLFGPPGTGKTMCGDRISSLLPPLTRRQSLETTRIHSVTGLTRGGRALITRPPIRKPHHSSSFEGIIGGGRNFLPGEISLAHNGVLFLDEAAEFKPSVLQGLREPVESGRIVISRAGYKTEFLSDFLLVAALNLCPCGNYGSESGICVCTYYQRRNYLNRIGQALVDRFEIAVPFFEKEFAVQPTQPQNIEYLYEGVQRIFEIQQQRFTDAEMSVNSKIESGSLKKYIIIDSEDEIFFKKEIRVSRYSARAYQSILKVARTYEDLISGNEKISRKSLQFALNNRRVLTDPYSSYL